MQFGKPFMSAIAASCFAAGLIAYYVIDNFGDVLSTTSAQAAGGVVEGPNVVAPDRYVYYPGTEVLAKDEVRVIACGTGMPSARTSSLARNSAMRSLFGTSGKQ